MGSTFPSPAALVTPLVDGSSVTVANQNLTRLGLYVFNPSNSVTLWVSPTGTPAVVNGAGSQAVQPLQGIMLGPPNVPPWNTGLNAISGGGPIPITVLEFYP
jgi:hypothetical protein